MAEEQAITNVFVTGGTGFVGRAVVRELLARGLTPTCLVRSESKLHAQHKDVDPARLTFVVGALNDTAANERGVERCDAIVHLAGIILNRRLQGQTFDGVHVRGTRNLVAAAHRAGKRRFVHMSALGVRAAATTPYLKTKWQSEECVRRGEIDWTILQPSVIHGPSGDFVRLMKKFTCNRLPPVFPCFGGGKAKVQPVSVKDVVFCAVDALTRNETIGKTYPLGGPRAYSWCELYNAFRTLLPGARQHKPIVSLPVPVAKVAAVLSAPLMAVAELLIPSVGVFRFDAGQVSMACEDSVCDHTLAEKAFGITMRSFEDELTMYADQID